MSYDLMLFTKSVTMLIRIAIKISGTLLSNPPQVVSGDGEDRLDVQQPPAARDDGEHQGRHPAGDRAVPLQRHLQVRL